MPKSKKECKTSPIDGSKVAQSVLAKSTSRGQRKEALSKAIDENAIRDEANQERHYDALFEKWEETEFVPKDFQIKIPVDSLESQVGYSSLVRQMHNSFRGMVAFHMSKAGGHRSVEEARKLAFRACQNKKEAKKVFDSLMQLSIDDLNFSDLSALHAYAPRVGERFWEMVKREGRKEFESGHLAANTTFPVGYMKDCWNIARYLGTRESFIAEWRPKGGIEISLIDMLTQSFFQWEFWLEQTVKRSQTREIEEDPEYKQWKRLKGMTGKSEIDGYWTRPYVAEQAALEHSVQMADRWNRVYMRTLRQLRDLRRYTPVTINNPNQVNIATEGGKQVNVSKKR